MNPPRITLITKKEVARMYGVSYNTILRYFKAIGIHKRSLLTKKDMQKFMDHYGEPY
ncbi:hypothetical protein AAG747_14090 [Rapidithrix thailandica]|uniref:Helix-turn-helix domain-containing protein n=1 Tax=Rapidithrix thailandica TaxID=413964 RepID=A0AAW9SBA6_9BACT